MDCRPIYSLYRIAAMPRVTPMRRQYLEIKSQYPDCILLFRMGDFYEMFDDDAEVAARELDITLTSRAQSRGGEKVPMAGVPYHAVDSYIAKLIEKGFHVAVCDQVSEPTGRGIVEREVTRVLTPGTVLEPDLLDENKSNYLMGILPVGDAAGGDWSRAGIAYADVSTGEFSATQLSGEDVGLRVLEELARLEPREVIMPETWVERGVTLPEGIHLSPAQDWTFEYDGAAQLLFDHFRVATLKGFGFDGQKRCRGGRGRRPAIPALDAETIARANRDHTRLFDRILHGAGPFPRAATWSFPRQSAVAIRAAACWACSTAPLRSWEGACCGAG